MPFPQQGQQKPAPKPKKEGCTIDVKKTKSGRRISFKGSCSKDQLRVASQESGDDWIFKRWKMKNIDDAWQTGYRDNKELLWTEIKGRDGFPRHGQEDSPMQEGWKLRI